MVLKDIEQNDVNISKLFSYTTEVSFVTNEDEVITFYQRLVGDEHFNQARVYALRKSGEMRKKLKNKDWEDREAFIPYVGDRKKDELIELISAFTVRESTTEAFKHMKDNPIPKPKKLKGDASREEQEKHQEEIDNYSKTYSDTLTKKILEVNNKKKRALAKELKNDLIEIYEAHLIEEHCEFVFKKAFKEYTTYYGTFLDEEYTIRVSESLDDFINFPTQLKQALIESYDSIDVNAFELKKLQEVTQ